MKFELKALPYSLDALEPILSKETLEYHYGKHHQAYVNKLNVFIEGTEFENMDLEEIIKKSKGAIFNNAAQVWNHDFYWQCLSPEKSSLNNWELYQAIEDNFWSFDQFKASFLEKAGANFWSGWTWLVKTPVWKLDIISTSNAETVITWENIPLLTVDVWEHAYYIDYRNERPKYLEAFFSHINWDFVEGEFDK